MPKFKVGQRVRINAPLYSQIDTDPAKDLPAGQVGTVDIHHEPGYPTLIIRLKDGSWIDPREFGSTEIEIIEVNHE